MTKKMTKKHWKILIGFNLLTMFLVLSPFLPGPSMLSGLTNSIFSLTQLGSFLGVILVPVGLIWTTAQIFREKDEKFRIIPILLWTVPCIAFASSFWGAETTRNFSRSFAIKNAANLIKAIDYYK